MKDGKETVEKKLMENFENRIKFSYGGNRKNANKNIVKISADYKPELTGEC